MVYILTLHCACKFDFYYPGIKGIVHPKMKMTPWFTLPQDNLGVYDFIFSNEYNWSYYIKMSWLFQALDQQ